MMMRVSADELRSRSELVRNDIRSITQHWEAIRRAVRGSEGYWEGEAEDAHLTIFRDIEEDVDAILARLAENPAKLQMMAGIYEGAEAEAEAAAAALPADIF